MALRMVMRPTPKSGFHHQSASLVDQLAFSSVAAAQRQRSGRRR